MASYVDAEKLVHERNVCCNTVSDSDNGAVAHKIADDMALQCTRCATGSFYFDKGGDTVTGDSVFAHKDAVGDTVVGRRYCFNA